VKRPQAALRAKEAGGSLPPGRIGVDEEKTFESDCTEQVGGRETRTYWEKLRRRPKTHLKRPEKAKKKKAICKRRWHKGPGKGKSQSQISTRTGRPIKEVRERDRETVNLVNLLGRKAKTAKRVERNKAEAGCLPDKPKKEISKRMIRKR